MRYIVRLGAVWLGIVGALLLIVGLVSFWLGSSPEDDNFAWEADLMRFIGLFGLVVGAPHMAAAVGVWRRRTWGRWLGAGLGGIGLALAALLAMSVYNREIGVMMAVGYGLALIGSVVWYPTEPPTPT
jgi:peptidoglycan/LPS O-acetylase OafA/YrhL